MSTWKNEKYCLTFSPTNNGVIVQSLWNVKSMSRQKCRVTGDKLNDTVPLSLMLVLGIFRIPYTFKGIRINNWTLLLKLLPIGIFLVVLFHYWNWNNTKFIFKYGFHTIIMIFYQYFALLFVTKTVILIIFIYNYIHYVRQGYCHQGPDSTKNRKSIGFVYK